MRTLKTLALLVTLTFSSVLFAGTNPKSENPTSLNEQIGELLKNPQFTIDDDLEAFVTFTFNKNQEIVVLSIDSNNKELKNFITKRLNYHKVTITSKSNVDNYIVPVRLVKNDK